MTKKTIGSLFSLIAISALTIGCGSSSSTEKSKTNGRAIDDYIDGATVCIQNTCVTTKSEGIFTFIGAIPTSSPLVVSGGHIHNTDINFTGTLMAPPGSTVVSPLTTLIQSVASTGKTVSEAQVTVKKSLGLENIKEDLTKYDPLATLSKGTSSDKDNAKKVFAQQSVVQNILASVSQTVANAVSGKSEKDVTEAAASQIATLMSSDSSFDMKTADNIKKIIENTVKNDKTISEADRTKVTNIAETVGTKTAEATNILSDAITNITSANPLGEIRIKAIAGIKAQTNMAVAIQEAIGGGDSSILDSIDSATALTTAEAALDVDASDFNTVTILPDTQPVVTGAQGGN